EKYCHYITINHQLESSVNYPYELPTQTVEVDLLGPLLGDPVTISSKNAYSSAYLFSKMADYMGIDVTKGQVTFVEDKKIDWFFYITTPLFFIASLFERKDTAEY
ncbi:MAG: hypothetical protein KKF89_04180, partial [Nanoarchaeota archaeon]|nr:hypothetical protein [Nanoarchaeota archaeon]MBU1854893.1 hypothetical protein [Nanoarchaeota archaeon]